jgi:choline dehydrogenase-like flavoprotein
VSPGGSHLVVGSGASAAIVALTLARRTDARVTVLDIGGRLEPERSAAVERLAARDEGTWDPSDVDLISARGAVRRRREVPQKRTYGSDYPFRDLGQTTGLHGEPADTNLDVVSSAYGGFTSVWGAQLMPFAPSTFDRWPISWTEMETHYRAVLDEVPLAAEDDDLADLYPLLKPSSGLPPLGPRAIAVLSRYETHRAVLRQRGVTVGRARLALRADGCTRCGLCMTGCPHALIYSAAETMDTARRLPNVRYLDGLLVERIGQDGEHALAWCRDLRTGQRHEFRADRIFVGAGGLGTTRLVLGSLSDASTTVEAAESRQFVLPFVSSRPVADPRRPGARDFTLNQFNLLLDVDAEGRNTSAVHCYPYNPAFFDALPAPLRRKSAAPLAAHVLRRLTVGFGYLPSWASPRIRVTTSRGATDGLPELHLSPSGDLRRPPMLGAALRRLVIAAPRLDLWPVLTHVSLSGTGKSYHFGGTFPHRQPTTTGLASGTDRWGRLLGWDRVHLIDGSVLPAVSATTYTLTVMANAHRIVTEVLAGRAAPRGQPRPEMS